MKKLLALTLTMAMLFTMTAIAEDTIKLNGETSKDVTATYKEGTDGGTIYSVDIIWGSMEFTYNAESKGVWKPETHTYTDSAEAKWSCEEGADTIVVTNHSNAAINVEMNYTAAEGFESIIGTLSNPRFELANADGAIDISTLTDESKLQLSGILATGVSETKIGEVTILIKDSDTTNGSNNTTEENLSPNIINMSTGSELNQVQYEGLTIEIYGENLSNLSVDDFQITTFANEKIRIMEINDSVTLNATESFATLSFSSNYFTLKSWDEISNLEYKLAREDFSRSYIVEIK